VSHLFHDALQVERDDGFVFDDEHLGARLAGDFAHCLGRHFAHLIFRHSQDDRGVAGAETFHCRQQQCLPMRGRELFQPLLHSILNARCAAC
jgi:hypothetical protein